MSLLCGAGNDDDGGGGGGAAASSAQPSTLGGGMRPELKSAIDSFIADNAVVLFMKGTRQFPQCGFSNTCIVILNELIGELKRNAGETEVSTSSAQQQQQIGYETVNVLDDDSLRIGMKEYSSWPTFPQLYVGGEFVGGCDIVMQQYQSGELIEMIEKALAE